jgi:hypothetical protein
MQGKTRTPGRDARIAAVATRQYGLVARRQLLELGLSAGAIEHRLARGRLHAVRRGVYAVGHPVLSSEARWLAAVLASGPDAVLSHRPAAALWGIRPTGSPLIEVTAPPTRHGLPGIVLYRRRLPPDEFTTLHGIPVTTLARTLLDLAAVLDRAGLRRAFHEAEVLRLFDLRQLERLARRHLRARGRRLVDLVLHDLQAGADVSRRELERRFHAFLATTSLPKPVRNAYVEAGGRSFEADCLWRDRRLLVELDGHATHATRTQFEADRLRDRRLAIEGWRTVRVTWRQLEGDPSGLERDLRVLLEAQPPGRG